MTSPSSSDVTRPFYNTLRRPDGGDYVITSAVTQERFDSGLKYEPLADDVFVATYPKNGTTWMIHIVNMLVKGVDITNKKYNDLDDYYTFLEWEGGDVVRKKPSPRIVKTHLPFELTPYRPDIKYIFVARNPKDCVVSFFHHTVGFTQYYHFAQGKFDDFCRMFVNGECEYGDYFEVVPEWYKQSQEKENICFFLYEDMKTDLKREVIRLAEFLGPKYKEKLMEDDGKLLQQITKSASINTMKANNEQFMRSKRLDHLPFVRKGVIGDWRSLMSQEQSEIFNEKIKDCGKKWPGFDGLWDNYRDFLF